ncbi:hypothetical protein [Piscinibacter sp.]|uniref:hypothetical protein n=1 Tax=Piscinibacter sp. TaxID=1903157 RepID=UPI002B628582|nr:hypothetical protein [Albitalea sp.]HUG23716.1 hypothetical protein [Albitalea sp.]
MNSVTMWLAGALPVGLAAEWWLMRAHHRRRVAAMQASQARAQQAAEALSQQARRQISQLQQELAALRLQLKQASRKAPVQSTTFQREQTPRNEVAARPVLPVDGFADTLPFAQTSTPSAFGPL